MSGLAEITRRVARLKEISGIMTAMKSLSLVETRKLARFIGCQRQMLGNIEAAAADFQQFFEPPGNAGSRTQRTLVLIVGSERGFCGSFNERVLAALHSAPAWPQAPELIAVGHRLGAKLQSDVARGIKLLASLDGPGISEDIPTVLGALMDALHAASRLSGGDVALFGLAHDADGAPRLKRLLPLPALAGSRHSHAPRIQLTPPDFFAQLLDQYLSAALYGLIFESLAAENHERLAHMEYALDRLGETLARLALDRNALRQERIIEEIEVMLTSEQAFAGASLR